MKTTTIRRIGKQTLLLVAACYALSSLWGVPYIFTLIAIALWMLLDHLITEDDEDDFLFDWHNPCSTVQISWRGIGLRVLLIGTLCFVAILFPSLRALGA